MSQSWRCSDGSAVSTIPVTSTLPTMLMTTAGPSRLLTLPPNNTVMFAPHLLPTSSVGAIPYSPFPFVAPSGPLLLSTQLPFSPTMPLSLLTNPSLLPHLQGTTGIPILTPQLYSTLSQSTVQSTPVVSVGRPLQSSVVIQHPFVSTTETDIVTLSSTVTPTLRRPIAHPTSQPPTIPDKIPPLSMSSSPTIGGSVPSLQLESVHSETPLTGTKMQALSQYYPSSAAKEHSTGTKTASLKKLLVRESSTGYNHDPMDEHLQGEPDLTLVYNCFKVSAQAKDLHIEVLPSQGNLKWLYVRQKAFHIDPELGPIVVARIIVSSNRIVKFQLLYPVYKTVFTKVFVEEETEKILSVLSSDHVICPGLVNYDDKFSVLGYHPSHVRTIETSHITRYDHEHCPIWHVPSGTFSKRDRIVQKMCKMCKYLQNSVVRLATKACEVDPAERESWTDPSSNRPLAYMSAADREERYRKLRQERNQMLVKLRMYEERLGIGSKRHSVIQNTTERSGNTEGEPSVTTEIEEQDRGDDGEGEGERWEEAEGEGERWEEGEGEGEGSGDGGTEGEMVPQEGPITWGPKHTLTSVTTTEGTKVYKTTKRRLSEVVPIRGQQPSKRIKSTST